MLPYLSSAWIKVEQLKPYHPHKEEMIKINKGKRFQQAVDAVEDFLKKAKGKEQVRFAAQLNTREKHCCFIERGLLQAAHTLAIIIPEATGLNPSNCTFTEL